MKEEIQSLLNRVEKYIKSGELLLENKDYESCVSRIYYAMFYAVQAVLLTKNLSFSSHKGVISAFGQHFVKKDIFSKEMSKVLNLAFEKRMLGDYSHTFLISKEEAEELLKHGKSFITQIVEYLHDL